MSGELGLLQLRPEFVSLEAPGYFPGASFLKKIIKEFSYERG
jgi:hypothetical protein